MIDYPSDLRAPLNTVVKTQTQLYDVSQPLSGPSYIRKLSTDAPVFYDLTFKFRYRDEALRFRAWIENNDIHRGVEFNCPIRIDGYGNDDSQETQVVRLVEGDIRSNNANSTSAFFVYSGRFRCRKEVTGFEDWYELIDEGGSYLLEGREELDISINIEAPEG